MSKLNKMFVLFATFFLLSFHQIFCAELNLLPTQKYIVGISHEHKFVWFRVAKVASSTVKTVFKKHHVEMPIMSSYYVFNPLLYRSYFKFAFVRNPWARVVSCYCQKVENKNPDWAFYYEECFDKGFDYFVDFIARKNLTKADRHIRLQTALIPVEEVDFIGRLENFDADFQYVLNKIRVKELHIPNKNPSTHVHYSRYYNDVTRKIIAKKYASDIAAFGYEFEYR